MNIQSLQSFGQQQMDLQSMNRQNAATASEEMKESPTERARETTEEAPAGAPPSNLPSWQGNRVDIKI